MSYSDPGSIHKIDLDSYKQEKIYQIKLADKTINLNEYISDQMFYKSKDGTQIPITCTRNKSVLNKLSEKPKKPIPTLLYAYGAYGSTIPPHFNIKNMILMNNMSGMYCVANIRGGGVYGDEWHV